MPESDAGSMGCMVCRTESDLEEGAGKRCWEYGLYGVPDRTCAEVAAVCRNTIWPRQSVCATGTSHHFARYSNAL